MDLTVILGPMKSGKSLELISLMSPLAYTATPFRVYQSDRHVRDNEVKSRIGASMPTSKVRDLESLLDDDVQVVGVDEIHMFQPSDVESIKWLLSKGTRVVVSGIDLDHRGKMFDVVKAVLELGPEKVIYRRSVCDVCHEFTAVNTQVLKDSKPFIEDLGESRALPADGTYTYEARCRKCFVY
jgi:thymidine kinase